MLRGVSPEPEEARKLAALQDIYYVSFHGLNLTTKGSYFGKINRDIIFGFRPNTRNKALRNYCIEATKILDSINLEKSEENKKITELMGYELPMNYTYQKMVEELKSRGFFLREELPMNKQTLAVLLGSKNSYQVKNRLNERDHPRIPLIVNSANISELRWCYADYISIPTKNGLNVLEMTT